jgi:hypothetical protein
VLDVCHRGQVVLQVVLLVALVAVFEHRMALDTRLNREGFLEYELSARHHKPKSTTGSFSSCLIYLVL